MRTRWPAARRCWRFCGAGPKLEALRVDSFSSLAMSQETPLQDPFEFLKKLWAPMGLPLPGMMVPLLDPGEIDKRIADLKSVENWLGMNLNVLRMTIQGLEMQKATLVAFQAFQPSVPGAAQVPTQAASMRANAETSAADAWWNLLQQAKAAPPAPQGEAEKKPK